MSKPPPHKHETKSCPACGQGFVCKIGDVLKCQCYGIDLSESDKQLVAREYQDCLCRDCLMKLKFGAGEGLKGPATS